MKTSSSTKTDTISFRLKAEPLAWLKERAAAQGKSPACYCRDLILEAHEKQAVDCPAAPATAPTGSAKTGDVKRLLRQAAWVIIVALHPEWDEEQTELFLQEFFR